MDDSYADVRAAYVPITLTGFLVGTLASDEPTWGLYGLAIGFLAWLGWVLVQVAVRAAIATRKAQNRG